jgi:ADP-heptose:LPS heptosyltransferase
MQEAIAGNRQTVLLHLASGIGNIVLATPLLVALNQLNFIVDVILDADYPQTADLLREWSIIREIFNTDPRGIIYRDYNFVIPAIPPFYWSKFTQYYRTKVSGLIGRPADSLFYQDEQEYYLSFARALGYPIDCKPVYRLPISPSESFGVTSRTVVIAPGCKTGEMAAKRWPHYPQLAERFTDVVVVGTADDLWRNDGKRFQFPPHVRLFIDTLTLRETAELIAAAGAVAGNDSGLSHIAVAVGTPTVIVFGPTPNSLGQLPPNAKILRTGLDCEPCWFGRRFQACGAQIRCLSQLTVNTVEDELRKLL